MHHLALYKIAFCFFSLNKTEFLYSQRLELQQRLLQQAYDEGKSSDVHFPSQKNPLEVSEKFVQKFNLAGLKEKEVLHDKAMKMLERAKVILLYTSSYLKCMKSGGHVMTAVFHASKNDLYTYTCLHREGVVCQHAAKAIMLTCL